MILITTETGQALVDVDEIATFHWRRDVRDVQTTCEVTTKRGMTFNARECPFDPAFDVLHRQLGIDMTALQFVPANEDPHQ